MNGIKGILRRIRPGAISASLAAIAMIVAMWGCSSTKHVPDGELLLDKVSINIDNDTIDVSDLYYFLRQVPNHKVLGFLKLQLATYNLSGADTTKRINKWIRSLGKPPVLFDRDLTDKSRLQLQQALINRGYMDATVTVDTITRRDKKKIEVGYNIVTGSPYRISSISYDIADKEIAALVEGLDALSTLSPGNMLDRSRLDQLRGDLATVLRDHGYFTFNKDYITFLADTTEGSKDIALTMCITPTPRQEAEAARSGDGALYPRYRIDHVYFITDYSPQTGEDPYVQQRDTLDYRDITVLYGKDHYIKPSILYEKCYIMPGQPYSVSNVERTYEALSQLGIIRYLNIEMKPAGTDDGTRLLNAYILMARNKKQGVILDVEGTNSEGDLGFGLGATYQHRNLAKHSELLTVKLRGSYESLSGNFEGLVNNRYTEYAGEVGIAFPKFMFPFLSNSFKRSMRATTEFSVTGNYQERPEYTRVIVGGAWKYKWNRGVEGNVLRNTFDLIDINYVRLPRSTINFIDSVAPSNPLLRYSYEDHFITRIGYSFYKTNRRIPSPSVSAFAIQPSVTTLRGSVEVAGNALYALSSLLGRTRSEGAYKIFGIQFAQYAKAELDYSYTRNFNARSALAFHIGGGIAVPYLNSRMVPFEKRFYAGGANSVRGWGVRSLGPGCYDATNSVSDFINQCGDILLNINLEYRAKLFWVFEGAAFIDGGNVWTIREYENQPGGKFRFNKFYKQIAAAYGVGLRLDFTYFLMRFDLGIKAHNPAMNQQEWPIIHPNWYRDATFHFTVGYPF